MRRALVIAAAPTLGAGVRADRGAARGLAGALHRKPHGYDPRPLGTLWDPMYFTRGYAVWIASLLYETNGYGEPVYVH